MKTLSEYQEILELIGAGTVSVEFALGIIAAARAEIGLRAGEFTITQAMARSGRSRGYFEARLPRLAELGLARKPGRDWLLKAAAIPERKLPHDGFSSDLTPEEIATRLLSEA